MNPQLSEVDNQNTNTNKFGDMPISDFRRYGYQLIDWIGDYFSSIETRPVLAQIQPGDLKNQLPSSAPIAGESMEEIISDIDRLLMPATTHWNHPAFFAYFATTASMPGILGELLTAAFNSNAMLWRTAPAATELEEVTLSWLREMIGLPPSFEGIIYDTASISTMHAIAAARERVGLGIREEGLSGRNTPRLRVYASEHAHSSIEKALITLGHGQKSLCSIPADEKFRMDPNLLAIAIDEDKKNGVVPMCVVATIGTTSTASIDPIKEIASICAQNGIWLHIDAAYGGSAAVVPELRHVLDTCERADSLVINPHKWLFTPIDVSVLFSRHMNVLKQAFSLVPEYLKSDQASTVMNQMDYGIQLGRRFRALKLWMVMRYFGQEGLAARIREHCRLAQLLASFIEENLEWQLLAPVHFSLVCFRGVPKITPAPNTDTARDELHDRLNEKIMNEVNATGQAFLSHTRLEGRFTLRLAIGNIRTEERHVRQVWNLLQESLEKNRQSIC